MLARDAYRQSAQQFVDLADRASGNDCHRTTGRVDDGGQKVRKVRRYNDGIRPWGDVDEGSIEIKEVAPVGRWFRR